MWDCVTSKAYLGWTQEWCYSALSRVVLQCVVFPCWAIPLIHHHLRLCLYLPIPSLPLPGAQRDLQQVLHGGLLLVRSLIRIHLYSSISLNKFFMGDYSWSVHLTYSIILLILPFSKENDSHHPHFDPFTLISFILTTIILHSIPFRYSTHLS